MREADAQHLVLLQHHFRKDVDGWLDIGLRAYATEELVALTAIAEHKDELLTYALHLDREIYQLVEILGLDIVICHPGVRIWHFDKLATICIDNDIVIITTTATGCETNQQNGTQQVQQPSVLFVSCIHNKCF